MAYENTIGILITAKDMASSVVDKAAVNMKAASAEVNTSLGNMEGDAGLASGAIAGIGVAATTAAVAITVGSAAMAMQFQQKMEMLHTNAGVAQSAIAGLSQSILDMSGEVGQGPEALAEAFYHVASAGTGIWTTAQELDILRVAAQGAAIGQADLNDTTYALTSAMASGVKGVSDAAQMMAVLNATVGAGDMKLEDLNGALSTGILSTAASFGISIQSVGAALATLTDNGEHADEAATRLRMTFALMSSPSSVAAQQLEALGLTAEDANNATSDMNQVFAQSGLTTTKLADDLRGPNGIAAAIEDLQSHLEGAGLSASETDAMLSKAFGGGRTDAALLTLLQNTDRLDEKFKVINTNAGNFASNLADQNQTASQQIKNAWDGLIAKFTEVGTATLPLVAGAIVGVLNGLSALIALGQKIAASAPIQFQLQVIGAAAKFLGDIITSTLLPPLKTFVEKNLPALEVLLAASTAPLLAVIGLFVGLTYAITGVLDAINWVETEVPKLVGVIGSQIGGVVSAVVGAWNGLTKATTDTWNGIVQTVTGVVSKIGAGFNEAISIVVFAFQNFPRLLGEEIGLAAGILVGFVTKTVPEFIGGIGNWFAQLPGVIASGVEGLWTTVTSWFTKTQTDAVNSASSMISSVVGFFVGLPGQIASVAVGFWNSVVSFFSSFQTSLVNWAASVVSSIVDEFKSLPGQIISGVSSAFNSAVSGAGSAISNFFSGISSGFSAGVKKFATGTPFAPGGLALVGENGPELVNLPTGSKVTPNAKTEQMLAGGKGITVNGGLHVYNNMDVNKVMRKLSWGLALA